MKYMGSKNSLLRNGLGRLLVQEAGRSARFVDLFSGSGVVASHVAERVAIPVLSNDLQVYSSVLAEAVLLRTLPSPLRPTLSGWLNRAQSRYASLVEDGLLQYVELLSAESSVISAREACGSQSGSGVIWRAYGGYYFSPSQAAMFDCLLSTLPRSAASRALCLASVIATASRCAASPGHTAQPFSPGERSMPFIRDAWTKNPFIYTAQELEVLRVRHALVPGSSRIDDANSLVEQLEPNDLVFVDPPYSSAQYSRFYHVLETMARGGDIEVTGAGRYPPTSERPKSAYSQISRATGALYHLIERLADRRCNTILTFPQFKGSNGVTGEEIITFARRWFQVDVQTVATSLSTLGGNNAIRASRRHSTELVLHFQPRRH